MYHNLNLSLNTLIDPIHNILTKFFFVAIRDRGLNRSPKEPASSGHREMIRE